MSQILEQETQLKNFKTIAKPLDSKFETMLQFKVEAERKSHKIAATTEGSATTIDKVSAAKASAYELEFYLKKYKNIS